MADNSPLQEGVSSIGSLALAIVDDWTWWRKALATPSEIGKSLLIHEGDPQHGYYRSRFKGGPWEPVAIWKEDGQWMAYRAGKEVRADEIWTYVCVNPVSYEDYLAAMDGKPWPDEDETVAAQIATSANGSNSAGVDEADELADQITSALKGVDAYKVIEDDATNEKALSLRNRLNELSGKIEKIRVKRKEPHLEAGRQVDAKFQPLVKTSKAGADTVKRSMEAFETKKLQERRKREKEEQDRVAAAAAAAAQSAAASVPEAQGDLLIAPAPAPAPAPAAVYDAPPMPIKAAYGRAASVQTKVVLDQVTDWAALATYMLGHPDLQEKLKELAQRAIDAGRTNIPGITTTEQAKVR